MRCTRAVVKLGGSVVTVKDRPETVNHTAIQRVSRALASYHERGGRLAVVHGGGSFGHYAVKRILDGKGHLDLIDAPIIQASMLRLAVEVVGSLVEAGLPAVLHPAHSLCTDSCQLERLSVDMEAGLVPVTYGDAVVRGGRVEIVSGDDIAAEAAITAKADCLIYATIVPGVLDERGRVVRVLRSGMRLAADGVVGVDVTGGMGRKVEAALRASGRVGNVRIIHYESLAEALLGLDVGTRVIL